MWSMIDSCVGIILVRILISCSHPIIVIVLKYCWIVHDNLCLLLSILNLLLWCIFDLLWMILWYLLKIAQIVVFWFGWRYIEFTQETICQVMLHVTKHFHNHHSSKHSGSNARSLIVKFTLKKGFALLKLLFRQLRKWNDWLL